MIAPHTQVNLDRFCAVLTWHYTQLFASDPQYAYAASKTTPADHARKMTLGLDNGTADKDGEGVKRTCKELGIKHTYKAIRDYLVANATPSPEADRQVADPQPGNYYVTCVDGSRVARLLGPFENDHQAALDMVKKVRVRAEEIDPRAHWYSFGTCRYPNDDSVPIRAGSFNAYFGLPA